MCRIVDKDVRQGCILQSSHIFFVGPLRVLLFVLGICDVFIVTRLPTCEMLDLFVVCDVGFR
eukprot:m.1554319 g.1554319  ORF g.1554319 m.1554319 type:complete len:62 (+) comp25270_c1_seq39:3017-3202(+)